MTVTIGLVVHARLVRLAAVRADELFEERTLPYEEAAVERVLRRWPRVRCCYEAGPTGFGLYRYLRGHGIECAGMGGVNVASVHIDGVVLRPTLELDGTCVLDDGRLLVP